VRAKTSLSHQWQLALVVARREVSNGARDWRIVVPILLLTLIFPLLMNFTAQITLDFVERYGASIVGTRLIPFLLMIVGFFPISFSLVIALESFAGERERLSLEPLLATPISDAALYLGKVLASLALPLAASLLGISVYLGALWFSLDYAPPGELLLQILLLTAVEALVMVSAAVVISSHASSVRAANLLASFVIIPIAILVQVESIVMFWGQYTALWWIAAGLLVMAILLVRTGIGIFNREKLLSGTERGPNLRTIWRAFGEDLVGPIRAAWRERSGTPKGWRLLRTLAWLYGRHLPGLLRRQRLALAATLVAFVGAGILGWGYAQAYQLPSGFIQIGEVTPELLEMPPELSFLPALRPLPIFLHNARALLLGLAGAPLSFGAIPLLLAMLPMGLIGFVAGQVAIAGYAPGPFLAAFVLPHGVLELPAAWIAYAFALRTGLSIVSPPSRDGAGSGLLRSLAEFTRLFLLLVIPMLLAAAWVEARVTPQIVLWLYGAG